MRQLARLVGGGQQLLGEEGVAFGAGNDRVRRQPAAAPACAASSAVNSSRSSGPSSSTSAEPERRTPSASWRMRAAEAGSSAR